MYWLDFILISFALVLFQNVGHIQISVVCQKLDFADASIKRPKLSLMSLKKLHDPSGSCLKLEISTNSRYCHTVTCACCEEAIKFKEEAILSLVGPGDIKGRRGVP